MDIQRKPKMAGSLTRIVGALLLLSAWTAMGQSRSDADEKHLKQIRKRDSVDRAVQRGLAWLVRQQNPSTGEFKGKLVHTDTALACIALMASGNFPGRSKYGQNLELGIRYLVAAAEKGKGLFGEQGNARMYGQGICTLALGEAYGMMAAEKDNKAIRRALGLALPVILKAQCKKKGNHYGGWRYKTTNHDADLSVTAWQILALRSAQNCKLPVPKEVIDDAKNFVRRMYNPRDKAFTYNGGNASAAMRSAGVVSMLAMGADDSGGDKAKIRSSASYLLSFNPAAGNYFYYQSYYVGTAANMLGGHYRQKLLPKLENVLVRLQQKDGEFAKHQGSYGGTYATAFAVICLSIRYQFLPIYQE